MDENQFKKLYEKMANRTVYGMTINNKQKKGNQMIDENKTYPGADIDIEIDYASEKAGYKKCKPRRHICLNGVADFYPENEYWFKVYECSNYPIELRWKPNRGHFYITKEEFDEEFFEVPILHRPQKFKVELYEGKYYGGNIETVEAENAIDAISIWRNKLSRMLGVYPKYLKVHSIAIVNDDGTETAVEIPFEEVERITALEDKTIRYWVVTECTANYTYYYNRVEGESYRFFEEAKEALENITNESGEKGIGFIYRTRFSRDHGCLLRRLIYTSPNANYRNRSLDEEIVPIIV